MLKLTYENDDYKIYDVIINNNIIGSVEYIEKDDYIENIFLYKEYRGKGYLRKILKYFPTAYLLPLPEHVEKFKHLGYTIYKQIGDDVYYNLAASNPAITSL